MRFLLCRILVLRSSFLGASLHFLAPFQLPHRDFPVVQYILQCHPCPNNATTSNSGNFSKPSHQMFLSVSKRYRRNATKISPKTRPKRLSPIQLSPTANSLSPVQVEISSSPSSRSKAQQAEIAQESTTSMAAASSWERV